MAVGVPGCENVSYAAPTGAIGCGELGAMGGDGTSASPLAAVVGVAHTD